MRELAEAGGQNGNKDVGQSDGDVDGFEKFLREHHELRENKFRTYKEPKSLQLQLYNKDGSPVEKDVSDTADWKKGDPKSELATITVKLSHRDQRSQTGAQDFADEDLTGELKRRKMEQRVRAVHLTRTNQQIAETKKEVSNLKEQMEKMHSKLDKILDKI